MRDGGLQGREAFILPEYVQPRARVALGSADVRRGHAGHTRAACRPAQIAVAVHAGHVIAAVVARRPLSAAYADRLGVGKSPVVRPRDHALRADRRREHISRVAPVAFVALGSARSALALRSRDVHGRGVFKPRVVCPAQHPVRNGGHIYRARLTPRPLNQLRAAQPGVHALRVENIHRYDVHQSVTSLAASATAKLSMRCTPTTFPPTNFTRMSSVTEPFAGKAKVSACVSGR